MTSFSWFDIIVVGMIGVGLWRGRTNGLSQEFLPVIQWLVVVVGGAFLYRPFGQFLADVSPFSLLSSYVGVYVGFAILISIFFAGIRTALGDKLASSDFFGGAEYYVGMLAGGLRFLCITLFIMSVIGARLFSAQELEATAKMQKQNFEAISFPTFGSVQRAVNYDSFTSNLIKEYASFLLIKPTPPEQKSLGEGNTAGKREASDVEKASKAK